MVIVNFKIVMGADNASGILGALTAALEGRAAATFVVLAGIGLGLAAARSERADTITTTFRRAAFLLVLGLLNALIFPPDILHYYAIYFVLGTLLLPLRTTWLVFAIVLTNVTFLGMLFVLDYDAGWNWVELSYSGFWTASGFVRNLFFNGWHPVFPWLGFLLFGIVLSRMALGTARVQYALMGLGTLAVIASSAISAQLTPVFANIDPELEIFASTALLPPMPLYTLAGLGAASIVIGLCLRLAEPLKQVGLLQIVTPAGRQTLTLYIAHIVIGMGTLEEANMLGGQTIQSAVIAAFVFCAATVVYALFWSRKFKRGPVEALMRKIAA